METLSDLGRWIFLTAIPMYLKFGLGTIVLVILSELGTYLIRGNEYAIYLQKNRIEGDTSTVKAILGIILAWPVILVFMALAAWNRQSLNEYIIETRKTNKDKLRVLTEFQKEMQKMQERLKENNEAMDNLISRIKKNLPKPKEKKDFPEEIQKGEFPFSLAYEIKPVNLPEKYQGQKPEVTVISAFYFQDGTDENYKSYTHALVPYDGKIMIFRTDGPEGVASNDDYPIDIVPTIIEALMVCSQDQEWLHLCGSGLEKERLQFLTDARERLSNPE